MKIIFIAGPYYSGGDQKKIDQNIKTAEIYQIALANLGIGFFCAHNHTRHFELKAKAPESFYKKLDMEFLKRAADAILAVPGWENSQGAKQEIEWAQRNGLRVFYPKSPADLSEIIEWIEWAIK